MMYKKTTQSTAYQHLLPTGHRKYMKQFQQAICEDGVSSGSWIVWHVTPPDMRAGQHVIMNDESIPLSAPSVSKDLSHASA